MGARFVGFQKAINGFTRLGENIQDAAGEGVNKGIDLVYDQSQVEVPKETGRLKKSGRKVPRKSTGPTRSKGVRYGDGALNSQGESYAAAVHEILKARHDAPTKAKFVEDPLVQNVPATKKATANAAQDAVRRSFRR